MKTILLPIIFTGMLLAADGATLYVSAIGQADGDGSSKRPFSRIQSALDAAHPGDTVELSPGVYHERVRFVRSGEFNRPIRLNGSREAIIDASEEKTVDWVPAPEIGPAVYKASVVEQMYTVTCPEGIIVALNEKRVTPNSPKTAKPRVDNKNFTWIWDWKHNLREGVGPLRWDGVKALTMYHEKSRSMYLAFGDGRTPRETVITLSPRTPAITIDGVDRCVVSGITIRNAWQGVFLTDTRGSVVENCRIERSDFGVRMEKGAHQCTVRFCDISLDQYAVLNPWARGAGDTWQAHKTGGFWDRIGIDMQKTAGGHRIHDNIIHHHWGGIQDSGEIGENKDLDIHHNLIYDIGDDGLEPDGAEENCRWYNNQVSESRCGFRVKCIKRGPMYAYGNLFFHNKEDFRNFGTPKQPIATAYIYFNTSTSPVGIAINKVPEAVGTPQYGYYNNLFYCNYAFPVKRPGVASPDWREGGNVFIRRGEDPRWEVALNEAAARDFGRYSQYLTGVAPGFRKLEDFDVSLTSDSPARNAGMRLDHMKLPGLDQFQVQTGKPDVGALPFGVKAPKLPRSTTEAFSEVAGSWPAP